MKLSKNYNLVTNYGNMPFEIYLDMKTIRDENKKFILWDSEKKEIVSTSNNPLKFDKIILGGK